MAGFSQAIGLFGATGELGRAFFDALEQQLAFTGRLRLFASSRSAEETRVFRDKPLSVEVADGADLRDLAEAVLAVPADVADDLAGRLLTAGVRVWDASGHLRAHPEAVPFADADADSRLIIMPDPLQALLTPLLQVLDTLSPLRELDVMALMPVSTRGQAGVRELARQTGELLNGRGITVEAWPQQVAFNLLPADAGFERNGGTARERRLQLALQRQLPALSVRARQCVVPVFYGAMLDLRWQHETPVSRTELLAALRRAGITLNEALDPAELPSPVGQGVDNADAALCRLSVAEARGMACLLADPVRVGLVRPLLARWLDTV